MLTQTSKRRQMLVASDPCGPGMGAWRGAVVCTGTREGSSGLVFTAFPQQFHCQGVSLDRLENKGGKTQV